MAEGKTKSKQQKSVPKWGKINTINGILHRTASRANLAHNQDDEAAGGIVLDLLAEEDDDGDDDDDDEGDDGDVGAFLVVVLSVLVAE